MRTAPPQCGIVFLRPESYWPGHRNAGGYEDAKLDSGLHEVAVQWGRRIEHVVNDEETVVDAEQLVGRTLDNKHRQSHGTHTKREYHTFGSIYDTVDVQGRYSYPAERQYKSSDGRAELGAFYLAIKGMPPDLKRVFIVRNLTVPNGILCHEQVAERFGWCVKTSERNCAKAESRVQTVRTVLGRILPPEVLEAASAQPIEEFTDGVSIPEENVIGYVAGRRRKPDASRQPAYDVEQGQESAWQRTIVRASLRASTFNTSGLVDHNGVLWRELSVSQQRAIRQHKPNNVTPLRVELFWHERGNQPHAFTEEQKHSSDDKTACRRARYIDAQERQCDIIESHRKQAAMSEHFNERLFKALLGAICECNLSRFYVPATVLRSYGEPWLGRTYSVTTAQNRYPLAGLIDECTAARSPVALQRLAREVSELAHLHKLDIRRREQSPVHGSKIRGTGRPDGVRVPPGIRIDSAEQRGSSHVRPRARQSQFGRR
jgi:hypothetical protein